MIQLYTINKTVISLRINQFWSKRVTEFNTESNCVLLWFIWTRSTLYYLQKDLLKSICCNVTQEISVTTERFKVGLESNSKMNQALFKHFLVYKVITRVSKKSSFWVVALLEYNYCSSHTENFWQSLLQYSVVHTNHISSVRINTAGLSTSEVSVEWVCLSMRFLKKYFFYIIFL